LTVLIHLKGFHALQIHRLAHYLWHKDRTDLSLFIQSRNSVASGVDIHPWARIGKGVMLDHATGIVISETTIVEDNVSILQNVTLGRTGNEKGDAYRCPLAALFKEPFTLLLVKVGFYNYNYVLCCGLLLITLINVEF
jgi:serine acetyltransferase